MKMRKNHILSWLLTAVMAVILMAGTPLAAVAADEDIVILYTNDVHCGVDDNIGYAGLALYKKELLKQTPYVTLVDAGDAIQGAPIGTLSDGGYLVDIMNRVGYDFAVPGNHEFDYGMERFLELSKKLNCGYSSCNFMDLSTNRTVFSPYKIFDYGDTRVAFVGACTPESFTKSTPAYFQDSAGNYLYGFSEDESGVKLYSQIQSAVDAARQEGSDYVILVGHLGENGVTERWSSDSIVRNTSGINAVIDGHSHETVAGNPVKNKEEQDVVITQTGTKLNDIGKLTIQPDGSITTELVKEVPAGEGTRSYQVVKGDTLNRIAKRELGSYTRWKEIYDLNRDKIQNPDLLQIGMMLTLPGGSLVLESGRAVDYDMYQYIQGIEAQYNETLKAVLGHTEYELTINNPANGERAIRNAETNLGDLTADAYRYVMGAEIGLSNGGGIRSTVKAGDITYNDTLAVFPYGNMGCVVEATGQQIMDALEMASRSYPQENGGFLQVSGLSYTIHTGTPTSVVTDDKGNFVKVSGAYRVTDIMVNGQTLDINKMYTVASHNYLLKSGGDGMNMFMKCNILKDETWTDVDLLSQYINENLGGSVGSDYADPAGQGRIIIE